MSEKHRTLSVRIDLRLTPSERDRLTVEARQRGISRQDLLRQRVLVSNGLEARIPPVKHPSWLSPGRRTIDRAIEAVTRSNPGLPRQRLEPIVCAVICALSAEG